MFKKLFFFIFLSIVVMANEKIEIFAVSMNSEGGVVFVEDEVNVVYKDYYINAGRARYDRKTGDLELFENVRVSKDNEYKILGEYVRINNKDKEKEFKPFYLLEKSSRVWISSEDAYEQDQKIKIDDGMVSGCNPTDPLWKMEFSSSDYNSYDKWLNMYNTRLYNMISQFFICHILDILLIILDNQVCLDHLLEFQVMRVIIISNHYI